MGKYRRSMSAPNMIGTHHFPAKKVRFADLQIEMFAVLLGAEKSAENARELAKKIERDCKKIEHDLEVNRVVTQRYT